MKLFVYGCLRYPKIQKKLINRVLEREPDVLIGYRKSKAKLLGEDEAVIIKSNRDSVKGFLISVNPRELKKFDDYEEGYERKAVVLRSGKRAQVYIRK